jgi:hypothetical protein
MDWADLYRHVALKRTKGFLKHLRFVPDDPDTFIDIANALRFKKNGESSRRTPDACRLNEKSRHSNG